MSPETRPWLERWGAALFLAGLGVWVFSWAMNERTVDGSVAVLGMSERGWRRLLDPGTLLLMAGLAGLRARARHPSRVASAAYVVAQLGLAVAVIGNVVEFWIGEWLYEDVPGEFEPTDHIGWAIFGVGTMVALVGMLLLAGEAVAAKLRARGPTSPPS